MVINNYVVFIGEKKKSNNYWTKEKLQDEANKYETRGNFWKFSPSAASITSTKKWMDELFKNHINKGYSTHRKIDNYWTKEKLQDEVNKYKLRIDLKKNNYPAYISACSKKMIDYLFRLHINNGYIDREEWVENSYIIYVYEIEEHNKAYVGLTNNITRRDKEHLFNIKSKLKIFCKEYNIPLPKYKILEEKLNSIEAQKKENEWVNFYKKNKWYLFNITKPGTLGGSTIKWTKTALQREANKYKTRSEFCKNNNSAYVSVSHKKWMDELFKNHINDGYLTYRKKDNYWTIDKLQDIVNKYKTRNEFRKNGHSYWTVAHNKNGWMNYSKITQTKVILEK